jgi:hypothetical protein
MLFDIASRNKHLFQIGVVIKDFIKKSRSPSIAKPTFHFTGTK